MARNKLIDVHNSLMMSLEALDDETLTEQQLKLELSKANAKSQIAKSIVELNRLSFDAYKYAEEFNLKSSELPEALRLPATGAVK